MKHNRCICLTVERQFDFVLAAQGLKLFAPQGSWLALACSHPTVKKVANELGLTSSSVEKPLCYVTFAGSGKTL